ncbi:MFS transporter [Nocardiopsis terrae]|nr:MFS transporter [Nocardiopsis terrae]
MRPLGDRVLGRAPAAQAAGARRGLAILCVTVTTSYGVLFYAFPVLAPAVTSDTGWSLAALTAVFSAAQVVAGLAGALVGRWLQGRGPRPVMTAAAVLAVPATLGIASAQSLWAFTLAWLVAGAAMAGLFYPPAFAALTHWFAAGRVRALTVLTLVAGLASTIFAPLTAALEGLWGWRGAYLVLALVLLVVVVPLHCSLPRGWSRTADEHPDEKGAPVRAVVRSRAFWALTASLALGSLTVYAVVVNLVPLLEVRGFDTTAAAWALGLGGLGQVLGRVVYAPLDRWSRPVARTVAVLGACAATTLLLALVPGPWSLLMLVALLAGTARGILTLVQATAVTDRWGAGNYAAISGLMHTPLMLAIALAPWAGAALAGPLGGHPQAFALLGMVATAGAAIALASRPRPLPTP